MEIRDIGAEEEVGWTDGSLDPGHAVELLWDWQLSETVILGTACEDESVIMQQLRPSI